MQRSKTDFRVVALSATPGTDINAVRLMLQNLLISNIELRSEDSPDIVPYTFQRTIEKIVVPMGKELEDVRQKFLTILEVRSICAGYTLAYYAMSTKLYGVKIDGFLYANFM